MFQLHDFSVYHPNSYIASRRSSLPRQGYGGVYERRLNLGFAMSPSASATQLRDIKTLPRNFSDFSLRHTAESSASETSAKSPTTESPSESSSEFSDVQEEESLPCVRLQWRRRDTEELKMIHRLKEVIRHRRKYTEVPSSHFNRLMTELVGMEFDEEDEPNIDATMETSDYPEEWNVLITNLVSRKKHVRAILDKEYRDSKRQASQMRQSFERVSERVVSRFDRLISDILCYARLVCHLGRQKTRLKIQKLSSDSSIFVEEKRYSLQQQLLELPRLRQSLLVRQASLVALCTDQTLANDLRGRISSYWSYAFQLCVLDSEIVLDNELSED